MDVRLGPLRPRLAVVVEQALFGEDPFDRLARQESSGPFYRARTMPPPAVRALRLAVRDRLIALSPARDVSSPELERPDRGSRRIAHRRARRSPARRLRSAPQSAPAPAYFRVDSLIVGGQQMAPSECP